METKLQKLEAAKTALAEAYKNIPLLKEEFAKAMKEYMQDVDNTLLSKQKAIRKTNWKERILSVFESNESRVFSAITMANMLSEDKKYIPTICSTINSLVKSGKVERVDKGIFRAIKKEEYDHS